MDEQERVLKPENPLWMAFWLVGVHSFIVHNHTYCHHAERRVVSTRVHHRIRCIDPIGRLSRGPVVPSENTSSLMAYLFVPAAGFIFHFDVRTPSVQSKVQLFMSNQ